MTASASTRSRTIAIAVGERRLRRRRAGTSRWPACGPGSACLDGVCSSACPSAEVICGGQCVDPATDNRYCGATTGCGVDAGAPGSACGEGSGCSAGSCASICGAAEVFCGTECVDPQTDTTYCGATLGCGVGAGEAGATCATPSTCSGARCTAPLPGGTPRLATGQQHTLFLKSDGTAEGWGGNGSGQLGDNSNASSAAAAVPVELFNAGSDAGVTLLQNIAQLAANASNSAAVKTDGTVWAWGANGSGQVGDGSTSARNGAVQVTALAGGNLTGAAQVAVGASHMVAVKTDGTVWAWGNNASNQLGDGTTSARSGAVQVLTGAATALTGVANVAVGQTHTLALKTDGTVWAWGSGTSGQLGGGTSSNGEYAVQVTGLTGILEIGAGGAPISAALKSDGTVCNPGAPIRTRCSPRRRPPRPYRRATRQCRRCFRRERPSRTPPTSAPTTAMSSPFSATGPCAAGAIRRRCAAGRWDAGLTVLQLVSAPQQLFSDDRRQEQ